MEEFRLTLRLTLVGLLLVGMIIAGSALAADVPPRQQLVQVIADVLGPVRPRSDGVLTVSNGNLFVQCLNSHFQPAIRCEAAGFGGEPWLHNVLTPERQDRLLALGFKPERVEGNFIHTVERPAAPEALAGLLIQVLVEGYGATEANLTVRAEWIRSKHCPDRIRSGTDGGGSIRTPHWGFKQDLVPGCEFSKATSSTKRGVTQDLVADTPSQPFDLQARYADPMAKELDRVAAAPKKAHAYVIFEGKPAYVQCDSRPKDDAMYCEAVSADAVGPAMARLLTPERVDRLRAAGFTPPGKVMNYWRLYPRREYNSVRSPRHFSRCCTTSTATPGVRRSSSRPNPAHRTPCRACPGILRHAAAAREKHCDPNVSPLASAQQQSSPGNQP